MTALSCTLIRKQFRRQIRNSGSRQLSDNYLCAPDIFLQLFHSLLTQQLPLLFVYLLFILCWVRFENSLNQYLLPITCTCFPVVIGLQLPSFPWLCCHCYWCLSGHLFSTHLCPQHLGFYHITCHQVAIVKKTKWTKVCWWMLLVGMFVQCCSKHSRRDYLWWMASHDYEIYCILPMCLSHHLFIPTSLHRVPVISSLLQPISFAYLLRTKPQGACF